MPPSKPKPLPADFYSDTATSVQDSVGAGIVEVDVDDIKKVVADDECDTNTSRIDDAQAIPIEAKSSTKEDDCINKEVSSKSTSNIDEAAVVVKEEHTKDVTIQSKEINDDTNFSKLDNAKINLEDLESQIEPITMHVDNISTAEQLLATDSSKLDEVDLAPVEEASNRVRRDVEKNEFDPQLSSIDNARLEDNEKGDSITSIPSIQESTSRIDHAIVESTKMQESELPTEETVTSSNSRLDNIKVVTNDAAITITSPSPSNGTITATPDKFVTTSIYNCFFIIRTFH